MVPRLPVQTEPMPSSHDDAIERAAPGEGADAAGTDGHWRAEAVTRFLRGDPLLYTTYLFFAREQPEGFVPDSIQSYFVFVVWFLAEGRTRYGPPLVIPDLVREAVGAPDGAGRHPLMVSTEARDGSPSSGDVPQSGDVRRLRYYLEAVPRHGLAPFLSRGELARLAAPSGLPRRPGRRSPTELDRLLAASPETGREARASGFVEVLARLASRAGVPPRLPPVSIVGLHRSMLGLGEDARCLFDCLVEAGAAPELVDVSPSALEPHPGGERYRAFEAKRPTASVLIFCLPVFEMMRAIIHLGLTRPPEAQYRIGYWPWETTALPANWRHAYDFVDEVWASSTFLGDVYAAETDKPVVYMPLHIRVDPPVMADDLGPLFRDRFTVLSVFDFNSRIARKNPLGAIAAFRKAFPPGVRDAQLLLKTLHGDRNERDFATLREVIGGDDRIVVVDGALSREHLCGLIAEADAYVSLHRAEGFGRPLAEAMLLGTPVVATGWSGPADFLTDDTGYPVRSTLRAVGRHEYPNAAGDWAEPDADHAAEHLRRLYRDPADRARKTAAARRTVAEAFSLDAVSSLLQAHLASGFSPHDE